MGIEDRKEVWNRGGEEFRGGFGTFTPELISIC